MLRYNNLLFENLKLNIEFECIFVDFVETLVSCEFYYNLHKININDRVHMDRVWNRISSCIFF